MPRNALPVGKVVDFPIPGQDPADPDPATLRLRVPTDEDMAAIENAMEPWRNPITGEARFQTWNAVREALRRCLAGFRGYTDPDSGAPLSYDAVIGRTGDRRGDPLKALDVLPGRDKYDGFLRVKELGTVSPKKGE